MNENKHNMEKEKLKHKNKGATFCITTLKMKASQSGIESVSQKVIQPTTAFLYKKSLPWCLSLTLFVLSSAFIFV